MNKFIYTLEMAANTPRPASYFNRAYVYFYAKYSFLSNKTQNTVSQSMWNDSANRSRQ